MGEHFREEYSDDSRRDETETAFILQERDLFTGILTGRDSKCRGLAVSRPFCHKEMRASRAVPNYIGTKKTEN